MLLTVKILPEYESFYEQNSDLVGWLKIEDTVIDYPVMQTLGEEDYYLSFDFNKEQNSNCNLILVTDSDVGNGLQEYNYTEIGATPPSTNLIIHGHTMKSSFMFEGLKKYADQNYEANHAIICFDSL
ncbi:MAG TPA: class B sortase [Lachnospiraceae bacterium]|nr:class B sortase [Lachnospiraceae bacterium]